MRRHTIVTAVLLLAASIAIVWFFSKAPKPTPVASTADMPGMEHKPEPPPEQSPASARASSRETQHATLVTIPPERLQSIGVKYETVERRSLEKTIRTVGRVTIDERRLAKVTLKFHGWIEQLFVSALGDRVDKGQVLFTIYSPDLVATQEEYLLALQSRRQLGESQFPEVAGGAKDLLDSARHRFHLWDITEEHIQELEQTGQVLRTLPIHSPITGTVIRKEVLQGAHIEPGEELYTIANLSHLWILADIYEYELPSIKIGQEATVALSYDPNTKLRGRIGFIYPTVDPKTRTAAVRFEVDNLDQKLKPEMYTNVELHIPLGMQLAVPEEAVLDTGTRTVVFVDRGRGTLEARDVRVGAKAERYFLVESGLAQSERVVASATFLIDSESKLMAATNAMGSLGMGGIRMEQARMREMEMGGMKMDQTDMPRPSSATTQEKAVGDFIIALETHPSSARSGENRILVRVTDGSRKGVPHIDVTLMSTMAMPGMPVTTTPMRLSEHGLYEARINLGMPGQWELTVIVHRQSKPPIQVTFPVMASAARMSGMRGM